MSSFFDEKCYHEAVYPRSRSLMDRTPASEAGDTGPIPVEST